MMVQLGVNFVGPVPFTILYTQDVYKQLRGNSLVCRDKGQQMQLNDILKRGGRRIDKDYT